MKAALWSDVLDDLASAKKHLTQAVKIFAAANFQAGQQPDYLSEMAFLHAMQCGYTSFEVGLKRVFGLLAEELPVGRDSHSALLKRAKRSLDQSRPAILDETLFRATDELRRFRHVAIHTYEHFDVERASVAVKAAEVFLAEIDPALARFRAIIDPD